MNGDRDTWEARAWLRAIAADAVFAVVVLAIALAAWYDYGVTREHYISTYVHRRIHEDPAWAFLGGVLAMALAWLISRAWSIKIRYVVTILLLGVIIGHLFWAQGKH